MEHQINIKTEKLKEMEIKINIDFYERLKIIIMGDDLL